MRRHARQVFSFSSFWVAGVDASCCGGDDCCFDGAGNVLWCFDDVACTGKFGRRFNWSGLGADELVCCFCLLAGGNGGDTISTDGRLGNWSRQTSKISTLRRMDTPLLQWRLPCSKMETPLLQKAPSIALLFSHFLKYGSGG